MARPELPGAAVHHSVARSSISESDSHPLFQPPAKNALLFFVWLWYIGLGIVKAALKSSIFLFFLEQLCYFNLSPQGDGNPTTSALLPIALRFQLIPARGRKQKLLRNYPQQPVISTYPRKGTETIDIADFFSISFYFNLSPQGDGNKIAGINTFVQNIFQLIPANPLRRCAPAFPKGELFQLPLTLY